MGPSAASSRVIVPPNSWGATHELIHILGGTYRQAVEHFAGAVLLHDGALGEITETRGFQKHHHDGVTDLKRCSVLITEDGVFFEAKTCIKNA